MFRDTARVKASEIGAKDLSAFAAKMEEAGSKKDIVTINKNTYDMLKQYKALADNLKALDKSVEEDLPSLDDAMRKDAYNTMIEVTNIMDYGMMETILEDLRKGLTFSRQESREKKALIYHME